MGILIEDSSRRILHANAALCALFGIPDTADLVGADCAQAAAGASRLFVAPDKFLQDIDARIAAGQPVVGENLDLADGRSFERDYIPVRLGTENYGHLWLYRDVTTRKKAEAVVRESETRYRSVVENQTEFVSRWTPDGVVTFVNDAYCRYFRRRREDVLGKTYFSRLPADEQQRMQAHVASFSPENPVQTIEHRVLWSDGEIHWQQWTNRAIFDADGKVVEFQSVGRDVTERRQAEMERVRSLSMLRSVLESSTDGVVVVNNAGQVLTYNQRLVQMLSLRAGWDTAISPVERPYMIARMTTDAERVVRELNEVQAHPEAESHHLVQTTWGRSLNVSSVPYREGNAIAGRVWNIRDITDQLHQQEVSLQTQKLEAVGLLAGGIAHDFNKALTIILGNVTLARQDVEGRGEASERLAMAESACLRARALTQQLLTFSRGGAPIKRTVALLGMLNETVSLAMRGSNVVCESDLTPDLWPVEADEGQIRQMLLNLLMNAKEAMPNGGKIDLSAQNTPAVGPEDGRWITINLRDHGVGIPPDILPRVFDPYFTTKSRGRGLGLSAAYSIVRDHGGEITLESQPHEGTVVTVRLPASQKTAQSVKPAAGPAAARALRILIMDDEDFVREIAGRLLRRAGHETVLAADGKEAIALYQEAQATGRPFDVTIMDIVVPDGMGGQEAAQRILAINPDAKIIVSSGYSNDPIMADFRHYGFCGVAAKPYQMEELYQAVDECMKA
jgi:PAS domain S-box-containing protein